jgi:hypothetical protein
LLGWKLATKIKALRDRVNEEKGHMFLKLKYMHITPKTLYIDPCKEFKEKILDGSKYFIAQKNY